MGILDTTMTEYLMVSARMAWRAISSAPICMRDWALFKVSTLRRYSYIGCNSLLGRYSSALKYEFQWPTA